MKLFTFPGKSIRALAFFTVMAFGGMTASAETIFEDFENLTLVDADGNAVTSSWAAGYGLSNGWKIIGGTIQSGENSYANFALTKETGKGWNASDYYLCSTASSKNSAYVFIPQQLQGDITFFVKSSLDSRSSGTSSVKVYEASEDGTVSTTLLYEATPVKGGSWLPCAIEGVKGKYIAINLVRCLFDDFTAEVGDGSTIVIPDKKAITVTGFTLTTETNYSKPVMAGEDNQFTADFAVTVKNTGNVDLAPEDVKVQVETSDGVVCGTATATETLAVDGEVTIPVTITADAGEMGTSTSKTFSFYVRELISNIRFSTVCYVYATPYAAIFAINGPDGYTLSSDETVAFGTSQEAVTNTVTIRNEGTAPLTVSNIELPEGYATTETAFTVEAGSSKAVAITLTPAEPYGIKSGTVTITHSTGTFSFAVSGTTVSPDVYFVNFEDGQIPASWTVGEKWAINTQSGNSYAQQSSTVEATAIVTQKLTVLDGETMTFDAKRAFSYSAATLTVSYSADQETWTEAGSYEMDRSFVTYTLSGIPAGDCFLKFEGQYVAVDNIAGFHENTDAPVMGVYVGETAISDGYAYDFELVHGDATATFTVRNDGTGTLTANISIIGEGFSADTESVSLAAGESKDITVAMAAEPWGIKTGTLTIGDITITLEGQSRDPEILFVDFEDGEWPAGWAVDKNWSIYNHMAEHYSYEESASSIVTAKLRVEEGMSLLFDAMRSSETYASSLLVSYSADKQTWTEIEYDFNLTATMQNYELSLPEGNWYVRFTAVNIDIDNITGVKLSEEVDHIVDWTADVPAEGMVNNEYKATLSLENQGMDGETVTVHFYRDGESVLSETTTMALNATQTITYSYTPQQAEQFEAYFEIVYGDGTTTFKSDVVSVVIAEESGAAVTMQGTVTDKDTDEAIEGATVTLTCGDIVYTATTDAEGKYSIPVYKNGTDYKYAIEVVAEGYESYATGTYYVNGLGEDTVEQDFQLTKNATTAISSAVKGAAAEVIYTLGGQRVKKATNGIYIVNGKKTTK